jgi:hypothetical protein
MNIQDVKILKKSKECRAIILYSIITGDKLTFEATITNQNIFIEQDEFEGVPELAYFRQYGLYTPRNRYAQLLHNVLCYYDHENWISDHLRSFTSSVVGTYYMAAGYGNPSKISYNMALWPTRLKSKDLLTTALDGLARENICNLLTNKNQT